MYVFTKWHYRISSGKTLSCLFISSFSLLYASCVQPGKCHPGSQWSQAVIAGNRDGTLVTAWDAASYINITPAHIYTRNALIMLMLNSSPRCWRWSCRKRAPTIVTFGVHWECTSRSKCTENLFKIHRVPGSWKHTHVGILPFKYPFQPPTTLFIG